MPEYNNMTNMKRSLSDSEDDFDDESMKGAGSPSDGLHGSDRKKRRGIIEKRRRDRINGSLSELRRLVPQAFEKQGSAKLEKAEILQMTVDHLKTLHSKGLNGYNLDTAALAMDYRSVGFRECAAEVARYLVTCEGMDIQDPLRLRLMSHLQCYSAQREAAAKASLQTTFQNGSWNHMASHHGLNSQYNSAPVGTMAPPPPPGMLSQHAGQTDQLGMTSHATGLSTVSYSDASRLSQHSTENSHVGHSMSSMRIPSAGNMAPQMPSVSSSATSQVTPQVLSGLSQMHAHSQFPVSLPMLSPNGSHYSTGSSSMKPYRPWGAELAY